jgi:hypothetical protein
VSLRQIPASVELKSELFCPLGIVQPDLPAAPDERVISGVTFEQRLEGAHQLTKLLAARREPAWDTEESELASARSNAAVIKTTVAYN